jgi:hypothetical protein
LGSQNVAVGAGSLLGVNGGNSAGSQNTALGYDALQSFTSGSFNTGCGLSSLSSLTTGGYNSAYGRQSGANVVTSSFCSFLGQSSGQDVSGNTYTASTAIGYNSIINGSNQIVLGGSNSGTYPTVYVPSGQISMTYIALTTSYTSPTLTITGNNTSFQIGSYSFSGTTNTVSALTLSSFTNGSNTRIAIYNGGSGSLTINSSGLGSNIMCLYSSNVVVPESSYALMTIEYLAVNSTNIYFVNCVVG